VERDYCPEETMEQDDSIKMESNEANQHQLTILYEEYFNKVARYAFVRIGDTSEAEDITSEVFVKALDSLKNYHERGLPMQAWIFKIAHNLVVDYLRKRKQRATVPIDGIEISSDTDPVTWAENNIEIARVAKAMDKLTEILRRFEFKRGQRCDGQDRWSSEGNAKGSPGKAPPDIKLNRHNGLRKW
jgi:RNA polymerase sigma-70 factor (ECF subfamily)